MIVNPCQLKYSIFVFNVLLRMPPLFLLAGGWDGSRVKASDVLLENSFCAKAEALLLKVIISDMSLILYYLPKSQIQASGGTER